MDRCEQAEECPICTPKVLEYMEPYTHSLMTRICIFELSVKAKPVAPELPSSPHCFVVATPVQHVDAHSAVPASATTKR